MNNARSILLAFLLLPAFLFAQTGATCATAIPLSLDNIIRSYTASSSTGDNVLCTNNGTTPVTWFSLMTNASIECILLSISASDGLACEVGMYSACNGSAIVTSSMCFYDGHGLWAPAQPSPLAGNTMYYLRIKTSTVCSISIGGQYYTPSNDDCSGALSISAVGTTDNNSCHLAGPGVTTTQMCASSLENTAWYQFYVATDGQAVINISNISCDNGANNNYNGFQIGFFTGSCSSLEWLNCTSGSGTFVQALTLSLDAGTKVYVAVDGYAGSNCAYSIGGINIFGVLSGNLKNFSGWKTASSNILKWTILNETGGFYEIERSDNATDFNTIGKISSKGNLNNETDYNFEDMAPLSESFYRLKQIDNTGKIALSKVIKIERSGFSNLQWTLENPVSDFLKMNIIAKNTAQYEFRIINLQGQVLQNGSMVCYKGINRFSKQLTALHKGNYYIVLYNKEISVSKPFVKMN